MNCFEEKDGIPKNGDSIAEEAREFLESDEGREHAEYEKSLWDRYRFAWRQSEADACSQAAPLLDEIFRDIEKGPSIDGSRQLINAVNAATSRSELFRICTNQLLSLSIGRKEFDKAQEYFELAQTVYLRFGLKAERLYKYRQFAEDVEAILVKAGLRELAGRGGDDSAPDPLEEAVKAEELADSEIRHHKYAEAMLHLKDAMGLYDAVYGCGNIHSGFCSQKLSDVLWEDGDHKGAEEVLMRALSACQNAEDPYERWHAPFGIVNVLRLHEILAEEHFQRQCEEARAKALQCMR